MLSLTCVIGIWLISAFSVFPVKPPEHISMRSFSTSDEFSLFCDSNKLPEIIGSNPTCVCNNFVLSSSSLSSSKALIIRCFRLTTFFFSKLSLSFLLSSSSFSSSSSADELPSLSLSSISDLISSFSSIISVCM